MIVGGRTSGKSTLINALMRRRFLSMTPTPQAAVIKKIVYGIPERVVFHSSITGKPPVEINLEDFRQLRGRYEPDEDDMSVEPDYAVMYQSGKIMGDERVSLVECCFHKELPYYLLEFEHMACAIVFVIGTSVALTQIELDYIRLHYEGRHMKNVFFICTHIDFLYDKEQDEFRKAVKRCLNTVFTDEHGKFDEELFARRVFYVDAYHSFLARIGEPAGITPYERLKYSDEFTGVPEFEHELIRFITGQK